MCIYTSVIPGFHILKGFKKSLLIDETRLFPLWEDLLEILQLDFLIWKAKLIYAFIYFYYFILVAFLFII